MFGGGVCHSTESLQFWSHIYLETGSLEASSSIPSERHSLGHAHCLPDCLGDVIFQSGFLLHPCLVRSCMKPLVLGRFCCVDGCVQLGRCCQVCLPCALCWLLLGGCSVVCTHCHCPQAGCDPRSNLLTCLLLVLSIKLLPSFRFACIWNLHLMNELE